MALASFSLGRAHITARQSTDFFLQVPKALQENLPYICRDTRKAQPSLDYFEMAAEF
ncbi:MAG TPA: hypothetical protein VK466_18030 [Terriglobales bacterium]|nr:hypothetical protein [Terriglobales bacterium]